MKILLINPPDDLADVFGIGKEFIQKYEPLGLLYVAAVARKSGYTDIAVIDCFAENVGLPALKERIGIARPDVIGISALTCSGASVYEIGRWIKSNYPETTVVLGNIHASTFAKEYLAHSACDIVVHGEGEYVFLKILEYLENKRRIEDIKHISYIDKNTDDVRIAPDSAVVEDLSILPFPARELLPRGIYNLTEISNRIYVGGKGAVAKVMVTSRGCPNRCSFCVAHHGRRPVYNTPENVVNEMEYLIKEFSVSYIIFEDSLFIADKKRILDICRLIRERKLDIKWCSQAHVNHIDKEIVQAMESAGCYELSLGIESGVQRLLDTVRKGIKLEKVREAVETIKKNTKILVEGLFILGLPGEAYEDSVKTIEFAKSLDLDMAQFSILVPYPGSPLFNELREKNEIDTGIRENGGLDTSVWKRYLAYISFSDVEPIWVTPALNGRLLRKLQKRAQREFYLRPKHIFNNIKRIKPSNIVKLFRIFIKGFIDTDK